MYKNVPWQVKLVILIFCNIRTSIGCFWKCMLQHRKRQVEFFEMHCFAMFIPALCVTFLTKLWWPKNKSLYGISLFCPTILRKALHVAMRLASFRKPYAKPLVLTACHATESSPTPGYVDRLNFQKKSHLSLFSLALVTKHSLFAAFIVNPMSKKKLALWLSHEFEGWVFREFSVELHAWHRREPRANLFRFVSLCENRKPFYRVFVPCKLHTKCTRFKWD